MTTQRIGLLLFSVSLSFLPSLSAIWIKPTQWYDNLIKPPFNPPDWLFAPAWTLLYLLMGIALYLFITSAFPWREKISGYILFGTQLLLNALWTPLFFSLHWIGIALIDLVLLLAIITFTAITFHRYSTTAGLLLVPYLLWVSFAGILNGSILLLNS